MLRRAPADRRRAPACSRGGTPRARGAANSLRLGDKLHVAVVVAEIPEPSRPLKPGLNYSYNVGVRALRSHGARRRRSARPGDARRRPADLSPRGCCATGRSTAGRTRRSATTQASCPASRCRRRAHRPADPARLLPPAGLHLPGRRRRQEELRRPRLGRRPDRRVAPRHGDATAFDANVRPHQLFLTGDQIYADDVVAADAADAQPGRQRADRRRRAAADALPAEGRRREQGGVRRRAEAAGLRRRSRSSSSRAADGRGPARGAQEGPPRPRARRTRCFDRKFQLVYPDGRTRSTRRSRSTPTRKGLRHWDGRPAQLPRGAARAGDGVRGEVLDQRRRATT